MKPLPNLQNLQNLPFGSTLAPGLNLLQSLAGQAGKGLGAVGQWVAPTMDPEEIEKRIEELRTVQFWLEQNAKILGATIQALEVQKMTLSTLQSLNLKLPEVPELMKAAVQQGVDLVKASGVGEEAGHGKTPGAPMVDPMAWWNALTEQFSQIAAQAGVKAAEAMPGAAGKKPGAKTDTAKTTKAPAAKATRPPAPKASAAGRPTAARKKPAAAGTTRSTRKA